MVSKKEQSVPAIVEEEEAKDKDIEDGEQVVEAFNKYDRLTKGVH